MSSSVPSFSFEPASDEAAIDRRFSAALRDLRCRTDAFFAKFLVVQWIAMIGLALVVSPQTWQGRTATIHIHVLAAIFLGGVISLYPAWLGWKRPGESTTRHIIAAAQMLISAMLIHITGGRIETHFHVFGSLAILALYRDARTFITATIVVYLDHLIRGYFWPESVYGVLSATVWRSLEHAGWVLFEVTFLVIAARVGLRDMRQLVSRQIGLEKINNEKEQEVRDRTRDLAASEEQFRTFFQDSPVGLYRVAPDGEFLMVNPALLKVLGFASIEEMKGSGKLESQMANDSNRRKFISQLATTGEVLHRDTVWQTRDGKPRQIRESGRAFRNAAGQIVHIDGTIDDITQHSELEERYQQAQKVQAIGQLAGGVAHDFNNIMTVITGYSQILLLRSGLDGEIRRSLSLINDAGNRATALTRQLLAFSRKQRLEPCVIYLNALTAEMDPMLKRLVGENVRIRTIEMSDQAAVKADPGQIQQVVMNLVVNARDAMPGGGVMTIETTNVVLSEHDISTRPDLAPGTYVMLAVSDTGTGMTPEVKARLFEPFFTTKAPGHGTGLGLATCHGIIKQSGGHITVYSEVGHGTTFKVYLPSVDTPPSKVADQPSIQRHPGAGERILLAEDDHTVRGFGSEVLISLGYQVISVGNGVEALQAFQENPQIALLITDVIMPGMGGRELVENLRRFAPRLPVLFTSGYTFDALDDTEKLGFGCDFISKPYSPDQLGQKVHACLQLTRPNNLVDATGLKPVTPGV